MQGVGSTLAPSNDSQRTSGEAAVAQASAQCLGESLRGLRVSVLSCSCLGERRVSLSNCRHADGPLALKNCLLRVSARAASSESPRAAPEAAQARNEDEGRQAPVG